MEKSIKEAHEEFVSGHGGSNLIEILLAVLPMVPGTYLASSFSSENNEIFSFLVQFLLCAFPLITSFTVFNAIVIELNGIMMLLALMRMTYLNRSRLNSTLEISSSTVQKIPTDRISFLTTCRTTVNLSTVIAILAVDFHIFPRKFAKTETFGYSLMDVGAPCYVLINAVTDSKSKKIPKYVFRNCVILLLLGFIRLISVSLTHYQHHVTEYGLHANFFFVLAFVKMSCCWVPLVPAHWKLLGGIVLAATHQSNLNSGLTDWTFSEEPRNTLVTANREFIVAMPGYVELYLFGSSLGNLLFHSQLDSRRLCVSNVVVFVALFVMETLFGFKPSRRLANPTFVAWIMGFFLLFLNLFFLMEKMSPSIINKVTSRSSSSFEDPKSPSTKKCQKSWLIFDAPKSLVLLEAINDSSLVFFLLGNLLTGLINFSINTLEVEKWTSLFIIICYTLILSVVVFFLYKFKKRK